MTSSQTPNYYDIEGGWIGSRLGQQAVQQAQQPAVPYGSPQDGGMMGQEYYKEGVQAGTWANDADARYRAEHSIDPNTGALSGPLGPVPAGSAALYQSAHEQALWASRQRTAANAVNYMRGALGLLTSYRPGGGAALQAGIHQNLSAAEFQRAEMMQPMDLSGDLRRQDRAGCRHRHRAVPPPGSQSPRRRR